MPETAKGGKDYGGGVSDRVVEGLVVSKQG